MFPVVIVAVHMISQLGIWRLSSVPTPLMLAVLARREEFHFILVSP